MTARIVSSRALAAIAGLCVCAGAEAQGRYFRHGPSYSDGSDRSAGYRASNGIWRHHGQGEGGFCAADGVQRLHGLGDGPCFDRKVYYVTPDGLGAWYGYPFAVQTWYEQPAFTTVYVEPAPSRPPGPRGARAPIDADDQSRSQLAWAFIGRGEPRAALREFAILALRNPDDPAPRVGYALAASMLHRHRDAAWAMRLAIEADAEVLRRLPIDGPVADNLLYLLAWFSSPQGGTGINARVLRASLHVLLGDEAAARAVVDNLDAGSDPAVAALRAMLPRSAAPAPAPESEPEPAEP